MKKNSFFSRVDVQTSLVTAIITFIASLSAAGICYYITHEEALFSIEERVFSIYNIIEAQLDMSTFDDINTAEDMQKESYINSKNMLEYLKNATDVMYLYTAKEDENGDFIYVIDGLSEDDDFRYPGDYIEYEIQDDMRRAISGEYVLPQEIKRTEWGDIFITYLPVHDENYDIVGVVGIEFEAGHLYTTYEHLKYIIPLLCIVFCIISTIISYKLFRRISNPHFRDVYNTDGLTKLKNRASFEVDSKNIQVSSRFHNTAIIIADLDGLKAVNDNYGHDVGDKYIILAAEVLQKNAKESMVVYRIGGDEFIIMSFAIREEQLEKYINICSEEIKNQTEIPDIKASASFGFSQYQEGDDLIAKLYKRADELMYQHKRENR